MAQQFNPATGQWEDDTQTSTGGDPTPSASFLAGDQYTPTAAAPLAPGNQPSAAGVGAPGNATNEVSGWYDQYLGKGRAQSGAADINNWVGSGLDLGTIQNRIANSPEAQTYAASQVAPAASPQAAPATAAPAGVTAAAPSSPFNDQVRQRLMAELDKAGQPVDPNSPEIAATLSSASDAGQRASDAERTALAERLYAQGGGLNTDALTRQIQQSGEKQAGTLSTLKAQLLINQYNQKREQLQQDLQLAISSGDSEMARQVQVSLANLQAAVQREGLGVNLSEFGAQLNQNAALAGLRG